MLFVAACIRDLCSCKADVGWNYLIGGIKSSRAMGQKVMHLMTLYSMHRVIIIPG